MSDMTIKDTKIPQKLFAHDLSHWTNLFKGKTFSRKLLIGVLPVIIAVIFCMGFFSYTLVSRQILANVLQQIDGLAQSTSRGLQAFFEQRLNDLESLSETPLIDDYYKNIGFGLTQEAEIYRRQIKRYFTNFSDRAKAYFNIGYIGPDGKLVTSVREPIGSEYEQTESSNAVLNDLRQGKIYQASLEKFSEEGPLVKRYAKPVFDEAGIFLGGIVLDCDMRYVEEILSNLRVGEVGSGFIEEQNTHNLVLGLRPRFKDELTGFHDIEGTGWRLGIVARSEDFLAPLNYIKNLAVIFSVLACVLVTLYIFWRISALTGPIKAMAEGTQRFASGDLAYRFREPETRELRILATAFNRMAENLEQRNRELEQRIRQLTALRDMEESVIQRLEEETILRTCLEAVARGFSFDRTAMYWVDYGLKEIVGRYTYGAESMGFSEIAFRKRRVPLGGSDILNEAVRTRNAIVVSESDVKSDPRLNPSFVAEAKTREFVMAPICGKDHVLGVLTADNYYTGRSLEDSDKEGLTLYANAVGLAMENTILFQTLAESEARYRTVLDNSPEAVIGLSREHWVTTWNRGAEQIFGYKISEIVGKPVTALFQANDGGKFRLLLNEVMEKGAIRDFYLPGMAKGGRFLDLSVSWGGSQHDFWMNKEWTFVIRDITEARRLQQQLIRSEKLSAVGQLISGIAHELNNPLQAVVGYSDLLCEEVNQKAEGGDIRDIQNDLRIITDNALRCQKIIENLLLFVRQGEIEKRPLDLRKVIKASQDLLQYKLKKVANIEVEVNLPQKLPMVRGNFQQIQQIFVNLINNACDAMSTWAGPKRLKVTAQEGDGFLRLEFADSGPGIPESVREHLFEPFFTTKAEGRGTGLGLAICRQIMEDHGGQIDFRTEVGYGTTFWFELPLMEEGMGYAKSQPPSLPPVRDKNVLLVDDEPDVLSFLQKVVEAEGDRVDFAVSLQEASVKASKGAFDLVIADIRLDEGTGINLFENWDLWSNKPRPEFLFLTGDVINATLAQEIEKKGLRLLHKPIDLSSFQNALRSLLVKK